MGSTRGVRIGVDVGTVRIGVAASDPDGMLATPVETVARATAGAATDPVSPTQPDVQRIARLVTERGGVVVYVGLPRHLSGKEGSSAGSVRTYCDALAHAVAPVPVHLVDERMSTVTAHQSLRAAGRAGRKHRTVVDQAAAVVILQSALDAERTAGEWVGEVVRTTDGLHDRQGESRAEGAPPPGARQEGP